MTTKEIKHYYLEASITGTEFACQVFKLRYTPTGRDRGKVEYPACPPPDEGSAVVTPGAPREGQAIFDLWHDTTPTGITTALITAQQAGTAIDYTLVWRFDDETADYQWSGKAIVQPIELPWDKTDETTHRGQVTLTILTSAFGRPAAQPLKEASTGGTDDPVQARPRRSRPVPAR